MPSHTQSTRPIGVTTPLGEDVLLLRRTTIDERMSALFEVELELLSENVDIHPVDLLGKSLTVRLALENGEHRYFNGYVSRFSFVGVERTLARYEATLVPWLWFLTRASDCRIFQQMTVPQIVEKVFGDFGFSDYIDRLKVSYKPRDYCVQYRETHFNFVSRLMEEEGIYWYFTHDKEKHTLVLMDDAGGHDSFPGYDTISYRHDDDAVARDQDRICGWSLSSGIRSGAFVHDSFDFEKPSANLLSKSTITRSHAHANYEIFDYPGEHVTTTEGEAYAKIRVQELQADRELTHGEGYARGLAVGYTFTLADYPRADQNRKYLTISASHRLQTDVFQTVGTLSGGDVYRARFVAMDAKEPFRAPRITPKPVVQGPQTARVVGPRGEEIYTDEYGRVKVQFHWDRQGKNDENSSCWIRVSHPWAGQNWGAIYLPRIGQEVIVDFLEGDPDRPIITGRVYNKEQMPPWALPDNATQSGIMSRSSKSGSTANANVIRMEDAKGKEEIYVRAEKDMNTVVEHDMNTVVENNATLKVGFEKKDAGDQTIDIYNNRSVTIDQGDDSLHLKKGSRTVLLDQGDHMLHLKQGGQTTQIDTGNQKTVLKQGNQDTLLEMGNRSVKLEMGNQDTQLDMGNCALKLKMGNQDVKLDLGKSTTEAMQSIEFTVGQSSIKIDQMGVTIKGMTVKIESTLQTELKCPLATKINGGAMLEVKGILTMIN